MIDAHNNVSQRVGFTTDLPVLGTPNTLLGYAKGGYQHVHQPAKCYPTLDDAVVCTAGTAKWAVGDAFTIVDADAITVPFDIHYLNVEVVSANAIYEIILLSGADADVEIARVRTVKQSTPAGFNSVPIQIPPQPANTKISAKVASNSTNADTIAFSLFYHVYS